MILLRALLLLASLAPLPAWATEPVTLERPYDPVILSTAQLAALPDGRIAALRLVRVEPGGVEAIPFQVDPRDRRGALIMEGPEPTAFDDNDDFVFMAADAGPRAEPGMTWPDGCDAALELTIRAPRGGGSAWAYLLHCAGPPPAAAAPYVTYDRATNRARSARYEVGYAADRNYFTAMRVAGADGALGANMLRQTHMRGSPTFELLVTELTLEFTEQSTYVALEGVRNGPVRAIRRVKLSVDLGKLFPNLPNGTAETFHYRDAFLTPTRFGIPALALRMLREFHFEDVTEFNPQVMPLQYWDATHPEGIALASTEPPVADSADHDWWVHSAPHGAVLNAFIIPQQWRDWGITRGAFARPGCAAPTLACAAGYTLRNMTALRAAGDYDLMQATVILPRVYRAGDEAPAMAMLNDPLQVDVARVR
ncbi:MAG: hypothetical protein ABI629_14830 [bacterium]